MEMIFCPNCHKLTGYKRALGFGTFFAVVLTAGFWLLAIPFYPKRCITCGLSKTESVPWAQTWRPFALVGLVVVVLIGLFGYIRLSERSSGPKDSVEQVSNGRISKDVVEQMRADLVPGLQNNWYHTMQLTEMKYVEHRVFGPHVAEIQEYMTGSGQWAEENVALLTFCKPHDCADHGGVMAVDVSKGRAAGYLRTASEVVVYLGDYESADALPTSLKSAIQDDSTDPMSRRNTRYVR